LRSCIAGVALTASGPALSQTTQGVLPSREEITPPPPEAQPPSTASVDSRGAQEQKACPFENSPLKLTIATLHFTKPDGSALDPRIASTLAPMVAPSGEQPIHVVCDIRDQANDRLRRAGWVASVQIPPQEINTGELRLNVVTAHIVETRVRGSAGPYEGLLRERIAALEALDPLNERDAERLLLLAGDLPGLDVQLSLRPAGTEQGAVIGDLTINYRRFAVFANAQNYNSKLLGRETIYARGEIYGLTGLGDITYVGASATADFKEQLIAQAGHIFSLDGNGTTFGGRFTYAWSRPDLGALDLRTNTLITGFDVTHPLIRTLNTNARISGGFDYVDQRTDIHVGDASVPLTLDKLRVGYLRLDGDMRRLRDDGSLAWSLRSGLELRKGFGIFGASDNGASNAQTSRPYGNAQAFVVRADADAVIGLGPIFSLAGSARLQWADDPLLNYEEFSLGNLTVGRGYDPGSNSGDRAVGLHGEVRANLPISAAVPTQAFGFYDYVYLDNLDLGATEVNRHFHSYGGGLRLTLPNHLLLEVAYAHPLDKALTLDKRRPPDRVLVSLTVQLRDRAR
jgi:hemolysin activation/secretion protein